MSTQRQKYNNAPSILLQDHENEALFQAMGRLCATLATGVVQLYFADQVDRSRWSKRCCGVACFVKDSTKRSFFIRVYDIKKQQMIWEQEIYNQFIYKTPREYFHTFEADNCQAGMNFASEDEALKFKKAVEGKLNERRQKRADRRRHTTSNKHGSNHSLPPQRMGQSVAPAAQPVTLNTDFGRNNNNTTVSTSSSDNLKKDKKGKDAKKKLTKADIGAPSDFRHVSHVGWDPDKGFDMNNLDPDMQMLFQSVGIRPDDNVDKETVDFIYDFVEKHGGIEAVKQELSSSKSSGAPPPPPPSSRTPLATPPPPPSRVFTGGAPPPPSRSGMPPPPPPSRVAPPPVRGAAPPPPPPSRVMPTAPRAPASAPPPPPPTMSSPPPPPPAVGAPPPPPPPAAGPPPPPPPPPPPADLGEGSGRNALMDAIRSGTPLKQAQANAEVPKSIDSRGQLLDAIRQGANLKKVEPNEKPTTTTSNESDGLVGALARALANRQKQIHGSDDEDDSDDDDDDVDDDDDDWDD